MVTETYIWKKLLKRAVPCQINEASGEKKKLVEESI